MTGQTDQAFARVTALPSAGDAFSTAVGPYTLLKPPTEPGDTYVQINKTVDIGIDADGDGVNEQVVLLSTAQTVERTSLSTPAGTFSNALRLRTTVLQTTVLSRTGDRVPTQHVSNDWYVADVGLVWFRTTDGAGDR